VDRQLAQGEQLIFATRLHKITLVAPGLLGGAVVLVGLLMVLDEPNLGVADVGAVGSSE
jgi:hypothetical protein